MKAEHNNGLLEKWKDMVINSNIEQSAVRPVVRNSWHRCRNYGLDPYNPQFKILPENELYYNLIPQKEWFYNIAKDYIKKLYQLIEGSGYVITLCDENGYVLDLTGDLNIMAFAERTRMIPGSNWAEEQMGSTGMGICLASQEPIQIAGAEHFLKLCHVWTCSAAPIFDPKGQLLGALNMSALVKNFNPHTLGMVVSAAKAISNELVAREAKAQLYISNQFLYTICETASDGLISVDNKGEIKYLNNSAQDMLNIRLDKPLPINIKNNLGVNDAISSGLTIKDKEINLKEISHHKLIATTRPIFNNQKVCGAVTSLRIADSNKKNVDPATVGSNAYYTFNDIFGESKSLKKAIRLARLASQLNSNIMLVGESGTGKELFAQAIHNISNYQKGPFIAVNCAAIPRELVSSELLGYSEGAFTGARRSGAPGKFELAEGGTIFLDEIESMPVEQQPVLLRILEERQVTRIGGQRAIPLNLGIITATNEDLYNKVKDKSFREDLYYRLNVLCIEIPPLRERQEDIILLTNYFLNHWNNAFGFKASLSKEALNLIKSYHWPGNVRELQNVIKQAIFTSEGQVITPDHLHIKNEKGEPLSLADTELETIKKALETTGGDIAEAARMLGISRTTIYRKLRKINSN